MERGFFHYWTLPGMAKAIAFIDGFNVYHAIESRHKWLDYRKLLNRFTRGDEELTRVLCFTAYANWNPRKVARHKLFIRALTSVNVEAILGEYKTVTRRCRSEECGRYHRYRTKEEKETDVNIATHIVEAAFQGRFDTALIVSADRDLVPAIKCVQRNFPEKHVRVILPLNLPGWHITQQANSHMSFSEADLDASLLPLHIRTRHGTIHCPHQWRL